MKKSTRVIACALSAALIAVGAAGCGANKNESSDGRVTVTAWNGNTHSRVVTDKVVKEWNDTVGKEKNIYYDVQWKEGGTITQNIEVAVQSGNAPDFLGGGTMVQFAENGYIMPIDDLPGGAEIIARFKDSGLMKEELNMYQGKTYAVPSGATTQGMVYNKEMFKAAGLVDEKGEPTPPKTFDELREYAKKLTNPEKKEYGIIFPLKWSGIYGSDVSSPALRSSGYANFNPVTGKFDFSTIKKIAQYWLDIKNDGSILPGSEGLDNDPARARFSEGGVGMKMAFSFDVGVFNDQFPAKIDWGVAHYPVLNENEVYKSRMDVGNTSLINAKAKDRAEQVAEVLKFSISDDTTKTMYKEGISLPWSWDIVKDVELGADAKKGWKEFAALTSEATIEPRAFAYDTASTPKPADVFTNDVWTGNKTVDAAFDELEATLNSAADEYYKLYPEKKEAHKDRVDPSYNVRIK